MKDCLLFQTAKVDFFINHAGKKSSFQRAMKTDEVRDRPLDSFGGRLPCCLNCIGSFLVTGRDASLPAPLLGAVCILVARGTVGALPQTPQGTLSLDPARGNPPLTPPRDSVSLSTMLLPRVYPLLSSYPSPKTARSAFCHRPRGSFYPITSAYKVRHSHSRRWSAYRPASHPRQ